MVVLIDNYDSFTYNIYQYIRVLGHLVQVFKNDQISVDGVRDLNPRAIVISPGPGHPSEAKVSLEAITRLGGQIPILGICLGHQAIGLTHGAVVRHAKKVMHGKSSDIFHNGHGIFAALPSPFSAVRYHSLAVSADTIPACLKITAWTQDENGEMDEIMGLEHVERPIHGVQFHPEAICTENGYALLRNFLGHAD